MRNLFFFLMIVGLGFGCLSTAIGGPNPVTIVETTSVETEEEEEGYQTPNIPLPERAPNFVLSPEFLSEADIEFNAQDGIISVGDTDVEISIFEDRRLEVLGMWSVNFKGNSKDAAAVIEKHYEAYQSRYKKIESQVRQFVAEEEVALTARGDILNYIKSIEDVNSKEISEKVANYVAKIAGEFTGSDEERNNHITALSGIMTNTLLAVHQMNSNHKSEMVNILAGITTDQSVDKPEKVQPEKVQPEKVQPETPKTTGMTAELQELLKDAHTSGERRQIIREYFENLRSRGTTNGVSLLALMNSMLKRVEAIERGEDPPKEKEEVQPTPPETGNGVSKEYVDWAIAQATENLTQKMVNLEENLFQKMTEYVDEAVKSHLKPINSKLDYLIEKIDGKDDHKREEDEENEDAGGITSMFGTWWFWTIIGVAILLTILALVAGTGKRGAGNFTRGADVAATAE